MAFGQGSISEGMIAYSSDGDKVGKVIRAGTGDFEIEKGLLFPEDYLLGYSDIARVDGNKVHLIRSRMYLASLREEAAAGMKTTGELLGTADVGRGGTTVSRDEVPITKEELEVSKPPVVREEIRVAEVTIEEEETLSEPVRRERVEVREERMQAGGVDTGQEASRTTPIDPLSDRDRDPQR